MSTLAVNTITDASGGNSVSHKGFSKAWASVGDSGVTRGEDYNVSSYDDDGVGDFGLNLTNNMGSTTYSVPCGVYDVAGRICGVDATNAASIEIKTFDAAGSASDLSGMAVAAFGDLA